MTAEVELSLYFAGIYRPVVSAGREIAITRYADDEVNYPVLRVWSAGREASTIASYGYASENLLRRCVALGEGRLACGDLVARLVPTTDVDSAILRALDIELRCILEVDREFLFAASNFVIAGCDLKVFALGAIASMLPSGAHVLSHAAKCEGEDG